MIGGAIMMGFSVSTAELSGVFGMPMASNLGIFISAILVSTVISDDDLDFEITL